MAGFWGGERVKFTSHLGGCKSNGGLKNTVQVHSLSANIGNDDCVPQAFLLGGIIIMGRARLVFGVGINDAQYKVYETTRINGRQVNLWSCPFYQAWAHMLRRCYSARVHAKWPTYVGCSVVTSWHSFLSFRSWMATQNWQGLELDKDTLIAGNKIYSPETCIFITQALNCFLTDRGLARGNDPLGVQFNRKSRKF